MWKSRQQVRTFSSAVVLATGWAVCLAASGNASELYVGGATVSITPDRPVSLAGQMRTRISKGVDNPVTATALAVESRDGDKVLDQAIMVSCDLVAIREGVVDEVRARLKDRVPGFDLKKLFLSATHTHTAPDTVEGEYLLPTEGVMRPAEYRKFLVERIADIVAQAWSARAKGSVGWGLGHAVVGQNRLAVYGDGRAQMYGRTDRPDFDRFEGYEDHGVEVLCFWDGAGKLIATAVNVACPAQEVEGKDTVNADFWHPVREQLRARHGQDLLVLGWTASAGDQSPHAMYRKRAEERMRQLRKRNPLDEIASRIVTAWEEAYAGAVQEQHADAPLIHKVKSIELPVRLVTREESLDAQAKIETLKKDPTLHRMVLWNQEVVNRFEKQKPDDVFTMELHVLRLGDVAIATNVFELYLDYGVQMKARSRALQTFVIQLTGGPSSYLPSARGTQGGAYGAIAQSGRVGPAGGHVLVERTVELFDELWPEPNPPAK